MKKKKQYALNKLFNFLMIFGFVLAWCALEFFLDGDNAWGFGTGAAALILIVPATLFTPYCYAFDSEGVSLRYVFLPIERYLWKDIKAIDVDYKSSGRANIFNLLYASVFTIQGNNVGRHRFYMNGHIRKTFRTKHLLEKYWDGTITGYFFEDVKEWINKRKKRKKSQTKAPLTDEVVTMEREIRADAREWLKPLTEQAKQYDLDIKVKYLYVTEDFEELHSRPKEKYTYTLVAEISRPGETNEDRIIVIEVDLLYVRLGKASYRAVINKNAEEEIKLTILDTLNEIGQHGIDVCCKKN